MQAAAGARAAASPVNSPSAGFLPYVPKQHPKGPLNIAGLRIKENKEVYEGEVIELTPEEAESQTGGYGKVIASVVIGLKTVKARRPSVPASVLG